MRTRIVFGCQQNPEFIQERSFDLIKSFNEFPPSEVVIQNPSVMYEVPISQVIRPIKDNARYYLKSDFEALLAEPFIIRQMSTPITYNLKSGCRDFDRVTIATEDITEEVFFVCKDAQFCDIQIYPREVVLKYTAWQREWIMTCREIYLCPSYVPESNSYYYFDKPPRYQIELVTQGEVDLAIVGKVLHESVPKLYRLPHPWNLEKES